MQSDHAGLALSGEEEATVRTIRAALPAEAADVHAAVTRLLFEVIGMFEHRLVTPSDVDEMLTRLADAFLSLHADDDESPDSGGVLALFTRYAMLQARGRIFYQLAWTRRN
jgi:hypothetical protein